MRRKTKKQQKIEAKFMAAVEERLRELGAHDNEGWWSFMYPLCIETDAGDLVIHVHETWVAMRFADVERAKGHVPHRLMDPRGMNPYTGKYNAHFGEKGVAQPEACIAYLETMLAPVLSQEARPGV